jgi:hypothetical protein
MGTVEQALATFERNIEAATGRSVAQWGDLIRAEALEKHGQIVAWLKSAHGFSHGHANHVAKRALEVASPRSSDDPVAHLFEGDKAGLRPLYHQLVELALSLGPDIEIAPKKANVSVRRRKQFALIQPSTKTRIDLGLILPGVEPAGRLEASGSFNAMFTHRVKLTSPSDVDAEVEAWMEQAYDAA